MDEVPGDRDPVSFGLTDGIAWPAPTFPGLPGQTDVERLNQHPTVLQPLHDPAYSGGGDADPFSLQENDELVFTPPGILSPELEDPVLDRGRGQGLPNMVGPSAPSLQGGQVIRVEPVLPAVEGLGRDAKMAAGQPGILALGVVIEPLKAPGGILGDRPLANQGPDILGPWDNRPINP